MFLSEWREFPSAPCLAEKKNLMTARVSMLLKSRASLTCFRACFIPGRAKNLSAPRYTMSKIVSRRRNSMSRFYVRVHCLSCLTTHFCFAIVSGPGKMKTD